jgi:hypothetical protein
MSIQSWKWRNIDSIFQFIIFSENYSSRSSQNALQWVNCRDWTRIRYGGTLDTVKSVVRALTETPERPPEIHVVLNANHRDQPTTQLSVSWTYLTTKIITLWEFFNFVREVSHLQYEWSSDCWCIWNSLGVKSSIKKCIFISSEKCFCTVFLRIFRVYLWLHMRVSWSISKRRDRIRALLSVPWLAYNRAEGFQESSLLYMFAMNVGLWNWPCM